MLEYNKRHVEEMKELYKEYGKDGVEDLKIGYIVISVGFILCLIILFIYIYYAIIP